ncbi:hypothetical protein IFM89_030446, partial [Coptis chinensis]
TELCRFSGVKIYPGRGIRFVCADSQVFLYLISKCKRYFHNRLKPSKLTWTAMYMKQHHKTRRRTTRKPYSRSIVGATLEVIQKKRTEKTETPDATREAALVYMTIRRIKVCRGTTFSHHLPIVITFVFLGRSTHVQMERGQLSALAGEGRYWKITESSAKIYDKNGNVGYKKPFSFYRGRPGRDERTDWIMHEYIVQVDQEWWPITWCCARLLKMTLKAGEIINP